MLMQLLMVLDRKYFLLLHRLFRAPSKIKSYQWDTHTHPYIYMFILGNVCVCVCVCVCVWVACLCVCSFVNPWTVAGQAALSIECSKQEYWRGLPCLFLGDLPDPGIRTQASCIAGRFFTIWATSEVPCVSCVCVCVYVCIPLISNIYLSLDF